VRGQRAEHVGDVVQLERNVLGIEQPLGVGRHVEQGGDRRPFDPRCVLPLVDLGDDVDIGEPERCGGLGRGGREIATSHPVLASWNCGVVATLPAPSASGGALRRSSTLNNCRVVSSLA
jgi:hypothetical protein